MGLSFFIENPVAEKTAVLAYETELVKPSTTSGDWAYRPTVSYAKLERQAKSQLSIGSSCGIWLSYLVLSDHCGEVAWIILLSGLLFYSLIRWLAIKEELEFRITPFLQPAASKFTTECEIAELDELTAPIMALISLVLPIVLVAPYCNFRFDFNQRPKPAIQRQVVDIELVAPTDVIDRHDILPSNNIKQIMKKQKGALLTLVSPELTGASMPRAAKPLQAKAAEVEKELSKATLAADQAEIAISTPLTFKAPDNWKTIVVNKEKDHSVAFSAYSAVAKNTATKATSEADSLLSEVQEANMIEAIDNDGESTPLTIQPGGRSENGKGAPSNLQKYLKQLNTKIKSLWVPPRGVDRVANIEFRINSDGKLLFSRALSDAIERDQEAEKAAILAISRAFPFAPLPEEIKTPYLDVRYTFNYRFNRLEAINSIN